MKSKSDLSTVKRRQKATPKTTQAAAAPKKRIAKKARKVSRAASKKETAGSISLPVLENGQSWVELFPQGISVGSTMGRPVLILKDQAGIDVLPVWMHPIDAGVALAELSGGSGSSPHAVTRRILEASGLRVESCRFAELIGHHQYVQVKFSGSEKFSELRLRADEAMSFCLQARARFFSTRSFMAQCRDLDAEMSQLEQGLTSGGLPGLQAEIEFSSKKHPYVL